VILLLNVDPQITLVGIIDLLVLTPTKARIIDYKTDLSRHAEPEYRKQLSVYYHVVSTQYPQREVSIQVLYTAQNDLITLPPMALEELRELTVSTVTPK
jgi:ATP-dependent exoDNAse (exonuclease V) beta subunit